MTKRSSDCGKKSFVKIWIERPQKRHFGVEGLCETVYQLNVVPFFMLIFKWPQLNHHRYQIRNGTELNENILYLPHREILLLLYFF